MKKIIKQGLLATVLLFTTNQLVAQQKINEGNITVSYSLDSLSTDFNSNKNLQVSFNGNRCRFVKTTPQGDAVIIYDLANKHLLLLSEAQGMKIAITADNLEDYKQLAEEAQKKMIAKLALINQSIIGFTATGQKEQIDGYQAERYQANLSGGESISIWTTTDIQLPMPFENYPIGTVAALLKNKKINGTVLKLTYGKKIDMQLKITPEKVEAISMDPPEDYQVFTLEEILAMKNNVGQ